MIFHGNAVLLDVAELSDESVRENRSVLRIAYLHNLFFRAVGLRYVDEQGKLVSVVFEIRLLAVYRQLLRNGRSHELQSELSA